MGALDPCPIMLKQQLAEPENADKIHSKLNSRNWPAFVEIPHIELDGKGRIFRNLHVSTFLKAAARILANKNVIHHNLHRGDRCEFANTLGKFGSHYSVPNSAVMSIF